MTRDFLAAIRPALVLTLAFALLTGLLYPLAITGMAQALFPYQANGSLVRDGDTVRGSAVIGQSFTGPRYFHGRPSAAGKGYDALASSGSNLGPAARALADRVQGALTSFPSSPDAPLPPADLVTTSASGLDPDISPEAALYQVARVARARGLAADRVRALVTAQVRAPAFGILGAPRVNVLALNRALDGAAARP